VTDSDGFRQNGYAVFPLAKQSHAAVITPSEAHIMSPSSCKKMSLWLQHLMNPFTACSPDDRWVNTENWWNLNGQVQAWSAWRKTVPCHFSYHKSFTDCPSTDPKTPWRQTGNWPREIFQGPSSVVFCIFCFVSQKVPQILVKVLRNLDSKLRFRFPGKLNSI
jgi:hypothetical protein